ncbi:hypothetical protein [Synechococcus sp. BDU 130192]|uniref:hypothetical protein n=2 Tax=Synechococcus sp. BDU 130192 TaxID=2042059 RepID=UPI001C1F857F|nr:hypothetical protein [Synechococcus sp. BDU 130192]
MKKFSMKLISSVTGLTIAGLFNVMPPLAPAYAQTETQTNLRPAVQTESDRLLLLSLLKSTLIAVNNANLTGNYSVLKELAAPAFQAQFSLTNLADVFAPMRRRGSNIAVITQLEPVFSEQPTFDEQGILRMRGAFPTNPNTAFNLAYAQIDGRYRLVSLYVDILPEEQ